MSGATMAIISNCDDAVCQIITGLYVSPVLHESRCQGTFDTFGIKAVWASYFVSSAKHLGLSSEVIIL